MWGGGGGGGGGLCRENPVLLLVQDTKSCKLQNEIMLFSSFNFYNLTLQVFNTQCRHQVLSNIQTNHYNFISIKTFTLDGNEITVCTIL